MSRRLGLCLFVLAVLAAAPVASADGPGGGLAVQGSGNGALSPGGGVRYFAVGAGNYTVVEAVRTTDGRLQNWTVYPGSWGLPAITLNGNGLFGGVSTDGRTLVLGSTGVGSPSKFLILDARTFRTLHRLVLKGSFAFDALSPNGSRLYLIQHTSINDLTHYVVRGYDLHTDRLLPGRIADKTQKTWVMQGYPMARVTSAGGRWVYTLYQNPGGYPFVHALDTVRGVAHCTGLPFSGDQSALSNALLSLRDGGRTLFLHWKSGLPWLTVDTATWRITLPSSTGAAPAGGFPWRWVIGVGGALVLALALAAAAARSRRFGYSLSSSAWKSWL